MTIFQVPYNWFKNWKAPLWLKNLIQELNDIMFSILKQVSKEYIDSIKANIIYAASQKDWSNDQKWKYVYTEAKKGITYFMVTIKDSELEAIISYLIVLLKKYGTID